MKVDKYTKKKNLILNNILFLSSCFFICWFFVSVVSISCFVLFFIIIFFFIYYKTQAMRESNIVSDFIILIGSIIYIIAFLIIAIDKLTSLEVPFAGSFQNLYEMLQFTFSLFGGFLILLFAVPYLVYELFDKTAIKYKIVYAVGIISIYIIVILILMLKSFEPIAGLVFVYGPIISGVSLFYIHSNYLQKTIKQKLLKA